MSAADQRADGQPDAPALLELSGVVAGYGAISVLKGISQGDEVVTAGQLKLRNGVSVVVNNDVQVSNDANPNPPNE